MCDTKSQLRHQIAAATPNRIYDTKLQMRFGLRFRVDACDLVSAIPCPFCSCARVNLNRYKTELNLKNQNNGTFSPIVNLEKSKRKKEVLEQTRSAPTFPN
jgi:hypothetical protein